ncbi:fimbrial protein [Enterobacter roggenkampii]
MKIKFVLPIIAGIFAIFGYLQQTQAACAFANGARTGNVNFALPALTQPLNPSDTGPRLLSSVTVPAATMASAMGISSTVAVWGGCSGNLVWAPLLPAIAGKSPANSGYMLTGIDNLYLYLYAGSQTTGAFGVFATPTTGGSTWSRTLSTIHGTVPPWSIMGDVILALYQTGPIRQGGIIPAAAIAKLSVSDGLEVMNMSMSPITVNVLACSITTPVVNVQMPSFYKSSFTGIGSTTSATEFRIGASCDSGVMPTITFSGQSISGATDIFAINGGTGSATGVGVQLLYGSSAVNQGTAVPMNQTSAAGVTEFPFSARYIQTENTISSGQANATITFTLSYK